MKMNSCLAGLIVTMACSLCLPDSTYGQEYSPSAGDSGGGASAGGRASASGGGVAAGNGQGLRGFGSANVKAFGSANVNGGQDDNGYDSSSPGNSAESHQRSSTHASGSRSVSFTKDGRKVSIRENGSGITVTIDGRSVRARDAAELKKKYPDAYRLYDEHIGAARSSASARGSASSEGGQSSSPGKSSKSSTESRSVSAIDNGKKVSITENKSGITVSINGKTVRAKNAADLKRRFPDAFKLYDKHLGEAVPEVAPQEKPDATELLKDELNKLRDDNANNPQIRNLIERMLQEVNQ